MDFDHITSGFNLIVAISVGVPAAIGIIWGILKFVKYGRKVGSTILTIGKEFSENGGSSIKDSLSRIEKGLSINTSCTQQLTRNLQLLMFIYDISGKCDWASPEVEEVTGATQLQLKGNSWKMTITHRDRNRVIEDFNKSVQEQRHYRAPFSFESRDGRLTKVQFHCEPILDKYNGLIGFVATAKKL